MRPANLLARHRHLETLFGRYQMPVIVLLQLESSNISAGYVALSVCLAWLVTSIIGRVILDVAAINYKSRRIGPAPIAIHFLHQVAGRVDHRRIDTGWENLNGPQPANFGC